MYTLTWKSPVDGVIHVVAIPYSLRPFSACGKHVFTVEDTRFFEPGVSTCVACWAREILEWTWRAATYTSAKGL